MTVPRAGGAPVVDQVAQTVYAPANLLGAPLVIAIVVSGKGPVAFDAGRAAQNMVLAAWNEGVSCPNGIANPDSLAELPGLEADEQVKIVVSFGYPRGRGTRKRAHPRRVPLGGPQTRSRRSAAPCARAGDEVCGPGRAGARRA
ncbi:MAG: nitroreductase family protein [Solirubrobacteraceae bacterium]